MIRKTVSLLLAVSLFLASCASHTIIKSFPPGADVYLDDKKIGVTPLEYSDFAVAGTEKNIRLEKEGYKPFQAIMMKDKFQALPFIGTIFCLFPIAWIFGYPDEQIYELEELPDKRGPGASTSNI